MAAVDEKVLLTTYAVEVGAPDEKSAREIQGILRARGFDAKSIIQVQMVQRGDDITIDRKGLPE